MKTPVAKWVPRKSLSRKPKSAEAMELDKEEKAWQHQLYRARQAKGSAALRRGHSHRHRRHRKKKKKAGTKARRSSAPAYGGGLVDRAHALERETGLLEAAELRHARSAWAGNSASLLEDESDGEFTDESDGDLWEHL